jgi:preprotein translocase subunit SecA
MLSLAHKIFGSRSTRIVKKLKCKVDQINSLEHEIKNLSADELRSKTHIFKDQIKSGRTLNEILPEAFACVRETSLRVLGMRHFDVQLIGGIVLHNGMIAEMKTGEGKTLVATLAVYLNSLEGKGVHVVTVNDYLAKRDSDWMGQIYRALGLEVGCILHDMDDYKRKQAYDADITYATNNELGFDYLRDNMKFSKTEMAQRRLNFAIVDEVDSILIDESRTPLIISGPSEENPHIYNRINKIIQKVEEKDYILDEKNRNISFTEEGQEHLEKLLSDAGVLQNQNSLYDIENLHVIHCVSQSLKAHKLFSKDKDYIVKNGQIILIDEFTGRMMEGRRYSEGLHQALESKENLKVQSENQTLASITFQNYFRMYDKLAGMTGTAATEEEEFINIYGLEVVQIPTHLPVKRVDEDDEIYATEDEKFHAILELIKKCHEKKQPVLIGTISIEKSEKLSSLLKQNKLKHAVLNAKYHEQEAQIIAQAGKPGGITIATNMAGRGTDIQLGGNKDILVAVNDDSAEEALSHDKKIVIEAGGLYVIGTERHESRRIDNQLRGRSGRQGDPGRSKFFLSLEDDLLRIFGSSKIMGLLKKLGLKENEAIYHPWITRALEKAQKKVEGRNYEIRKTLIKFDDVINDQRKIIFSQRNNILSNTDFNLSEIVKEVNNQILISAKQKNLYDLEYIKVQMKSIYNLDLDDLDNQEDIEDYIDEVTLSTINHKETTYIEKKLLPIVKQRIMLSILDQLWKEHLYFLDHLRFSVNLRAVAQKNPLNEFKHEAFYAFQDLLYNWNKTVINTFLRVKITGY